MSAVDPWRVLAVVLIAVGLLGTVVAGSMIATGLEANSYSYKMSLHEEGAPDSPNATVYAYDNLSTGAQAAFDDLHDGEAHSATSIPESRARRLDAETELALFDRINVRYQGDIYWLYLGERAERSTSVQMAFAGVIVVGPPLVVALLGGLLYLRRRNR